MKLDPNIALCPACGQPFVKTPRSKRKFCLKCKPPKFRAHGFRNRDGYWHSEREWKRYLVLKDDEAHGNIQDLKRQVTYSLNLSVGTGRERDLYHICDYVADFVYLVRTHFDGRTYSFSRVVEDTKGYKKGTAYALFKVKKALMKAINDIEVKEV